jgi:hypothetical protein
LPEIDSDPPSSTFFLVISLITTVVHESVWKGVYTGRSVHTLGGATDEPIYQW